MSTIHDQAMNYVYQQVLQRLLSYFSRAERTALQLLIQRLMVHAGGTERIGDYKVLVTQTGGRDSAYMLALLRAAQLSIAGRAPATFQIRVATLRSSAIREAALGNMHRRYGALFLYDDPRVELLMVDDRQVLAFNHQAPLSAEAFEADRLNMLLMGHRRDHDELLDTGADACLTTAEFYGQTARWGDGVDALLVGDSPRRQGQFIEHLARSAEKAGLGTLSPDPHGFEDLYSLIDRLGGDFYREFHPEIERSPWRPEGGFEACRRTSIIGIHDMLTGNPGARWPLFTDFLDFRVEDEAPNQGENDSVSPLITAHLRGLESQFKNGKTYAQGFSEQAQGHLATLREAKVPESVCEQLISALDDLHDPEALRVRAVATLQQLYDVNESQTVCLLFAPFINRGAGLERFLRACHPGMLVAMPDLHRAMQGLHAPEQVLQWMMDVSGLPVSILGRLYGMDSVPVLTVQPVTGTGRDAMDVAMSDRSAEG